MNHVEEFKGETREQRAKGTNLIFAYTVGTYVLFLLTLIIVYWWRITAGNMRLCASWAESMAIQHL